MPLAKLVDGWFLPKTGSMQLHHNQLKRMKYIMATAQAKMWERVLLENKSGDSISGCLLVTNPRDFQAPTDTLASALKKWVEERPKDIPIVAKTLHKDFHLHFAGRVGMIETEQSFPLGNVYGIPLYLDGSEHYSMLGDFVNWAWLVPTTTDHSKATLILQEILK